MRITKQEKNTILSNAWYAGINYLSDHPIPEHETLLNTVFYQIRIYAEWPLHYFHVYKIKNGVPMNPGNIPMAALTVPREMCLCATSNPSQIIIFFNYKTLEIINIIITKKL